jgi:hypothetical protein
MKKTTLLGLITSFFMVIIISVYAQPPTIASVSPTSGPIGRLVTITGTNFAVSPANNIVYFGATKATVTSANLNQLTVTVPKGATYHPISVSVNGLTAYSSIPFMVTFASSGTVDANTFAPKVNFTTNTDAVNLHMADFDGDGKPDYVNGNYGSGSGTTVSVFRNTSVSGTIDASSLASKVDLAANMGTVAVNYVDIDGDGKFDVVAANQGNHTLSVFRNISTSGTLATSSFATKVDFSTGLTPNDIAIADFDNDGKPDIVVANNASNTISIFKNTSVTGIIDTNSLAAKVDLITGSNPWSVAVGDFDLDGKTDIVSSNSGGNSISVFKNLSSTGTIDGTSFSAKVDFTTGSSPRFVAVGDVDGDGKLDIATANNYSGTASVFKNTSTQGVINTNTFASKVDFAAGSGPWGINFGDVNGDGKLELAVINNSSGSVSIFKNVSSNGTINSSSFNPKVDFLTGTAPVSVVFGDLDGDGKTDMATMGQSVLSIFKNNSSGSSVSGPYVSGPANGAINTNISLTLNSTAITGATTYTIDISPDNNFATGVITKAGARSQAFTGLSYGTTYFARVKTDLSSVYGKVTSFTTGPPEQFTYVATLANNAINQNVTLNIWSTLVSGATTYYIDISPDNTFATGVISKSGTRSQVFSGLAYATVYYARVKTDLSSVYGKVTSFTTGPPELFTYVSSPGNGAINTNVTLNISSTTVTGATTYTIDLSTDNFSTIFQTKSGTRTQSFSGLSYSTKYYARVKTDLSANYGKTTSFTTGSPELFTYVSMPGNNATGISINPKVTSTLVSGASTYTIDISTDNTFTTGVISLSGAQSQTFSGLTYDTKYFAHVKTDLSPNYGKITSFTTMPVTSLYYITSPANDATNIPYVTNVTAYAVPNATQYTIELNPDVNFGAGTAIVKTSASRTIGFTLGYDTKYYARVTTDFDNTWGTIIRSFTTGDPLSLAYVTSPKNGGTGVPTSVNVYSNIVPGASSYSIELNTMPDFSGTSIVKTSATRAVSFTGLTINQIYYTRVQTNVDPGQWGTKSTSFTTLSSAPLARASDDWVGDTGEEAIEFGPVETNVYPIPFHDKLNIHMQTDAQEQMMIQLYDITGKEAGKHFGITNSLMEIQTTEMSSGMYVMKIVTSNGVVVKKLIKE